MFVNNVQNGIEQTWTSGRFYKELLGKTNNPVYKEFIEQAENDKRKHYELLQYVHYMLTGEYHTLNKQERTFSTFREGVLIALKKELKEAAFYRDLLMDIPGWHVYQPIFIVMTDASINAMRFICIYNALK
ncbi:hypothetical protein [Bacillus sp. SG-1]|uniref:hypothetical protein n=1 Tax=Bacillus sp. SG-1 TaxID=161544 RepID=UPI0001544C52|nr:hypothetical protein [Bacillus sp. SG-1]EDL63230.1 hypothetical protein BSG1_09888 [Bacillus sp. SG-1]